MRNKTGSVGSRYPRGERARASLDRITRHIKPPEPSGWLSASIARYVAASVQLTQQQLAEILDVNQSYISRVMNGEKNFTLSHLELLGQFLGIPVAVLVWKATASQLPTNRAKQDLFESIDDLLRAAYPDHFKGH
jgi:transcriptional regulator with XRE-family HTH domain